MAVFTILTSRDIENTVSRYDLGVLVSFSPISSGIENTNYFVDTLWQGQKKSWVLTLFENLSNSELPYFVSLMRLLADNGLGVPAVELDRCGQAVIHVNGKYGVLVPRLPGKSLIAPRKEHAVLIGEWLAHMHGVAATSTLWRQPPRDHHWFATRTEQLLPILSSEDRQLMHRLHDRLDGWMAQLNACPKGLIHGDLFCDNVLFNRGQISGVIDFYHSCHAPLVFDLAVAINDWRHEASLVQGYETVRLLQPTERASLPIARIMAAWSFWLSRLLTKFRISYQNSASTGQVIKDPDEMRCRVQSLLSAAL